MGKIVLDVKGGKPFRVYGETQFTGNLTVEEVKTATPKRLNSVY